MRTLRVACVCLNKAFSFAPRSTYKVLTHITNFQLLKTTTVILINVTSGFWMLKEHVLIH